MSFDTTGFDWDIESSDPYRRRKKFFRLKDGAIPPCRNPIEELAELADRMDLNPNDLEGSTRLPNTGPFTRTAFYGEHELLKTEDFEAFIEQMSSMKDRHMIFCLQPV